MAFLGLGAMSKETTLLHPLSTSISTSRWPTNPLPPVTQQAVGMSLKPGPASPFLGAIFNLDVIFSLVSDSLAGTWVQTMPFLPKRKEETFLHTQL
jgi:Na+/H+ antiporter NhaC